MKILVPAIIAAICMLILLIFLPSSGFPGADAYIYDKTHVAGFDLQNATDSSYWEGVTDGGTAGYEPEEPGAAGTTDNHLPDGVTYAAGISQDAQDINNEFYNLATKLASLAPDIPNQKAHAFYLMSVTEQEQGKYAPGDPTLSQVFHPFLWHVADYATDNTIIKNAWAGNTRGARIWWSPDPDPNAGGILGPASAYSWSMTNQGYRDDSGMADEIGKNADGTVERTQGGLPGHNTNFYDAFTITSGTLVNELWNRLNSDKRAEVTQLCSESDYFYIGYTALCLNFGTSLATGANGVMQHCENFENMTPEFAIEWCQELSNDATTNQLRAWVDKVKPASMNRTNDSRAIWYAILKDAQARCGNDFFNGRYETNGASKPYHTGQDTQQNHWYSYNTREASGQPAGTLFNSNKISTPIKLITQAIILEKRFSGAY